MTVDSEQSVFSYAGNGVTVDFNFSNTLYEKTSIDVTQVVDSIDSSGVVVELVLDTDYTVALASDFSTAVITVTTAVPSLSTITIARNQELLQEDTYQNGGPFPAKSHEKALDREITAAQSVKQGYVRTPRLPFYLPPSEVLDIASNPLADFPKLDRSTGKWIMSVIGNIGTAIIQDGAVTTPKLSNGAVTAEKMEDLNAYSVFANPTGSTTTPAITDVNDLPVTATGSTTRRDFKARFGEVINVLDFGADPTGVADSTTVLQDAIDAAASASKIIYFPPGDYRTTSTLLMLGTFDVLGYGARLFANNFADLIQLGDNSKSRIEGLTLDSTFVASLETNGLVFSLHADLYDLDFINCTFTCPNSLNNAIKFVVEDNGSEARNVRFLGCKFLDCHRMGIEIQSHGLVEDYRFSGIVIADCVFDKIGTNGSFGFSISLSGYGDSNIICNNVFSEISIAVEMIGASSTVIQGNVIRSYNAASPFKTWLSMTNFREMHNNRVIGNISEARSNTIQIRTQTGLISSGNEYNGLLELKSCSDCIFTGDRIVNDQVHAAVLDGDVTGTRFYGCRFDNTDAVTNNATFRTTNANVVDNQLLGCDLVNASGATIDAISGADLATVYYTNENGVITSDPIGQPYVANGIRKDTGGDATSVIITLPTAISWLAFTIDVAVASTTPSGTNNGWVGERIFGRSLSGSSAVVNSQQALVTASDLTITYVLADDTVTLTCTSTGFTNLNFVWDVKVASSAGTAIVV